MRKILPILFVLIGMVGLGQVPAPIHPTATGKLVGNFLWLGLSHDSLYRIELSPNKDSLFLNNYVFVGGRPSPWEYDADSNIVNTNSNGVVRIKTLPLYRVPPQYFITAYDSSNNALTKYPVSSLINHDTVVTDTTGFDPTCTGVTIWYAGDSTLWRHEYEIDPETGDTVGCHWTQPPMDVPTQVWYHTATGNYTLPYYPNDYVGIGTTSPLYKFHVKSPGYTAIYGQNSSGGYGVMGTGAIGVYGGATASSAFAGVKGVSTLGPGVEGSSTSGSGGRFASISGYGLDVYRGTSHLDSLLYVGHIPVKTSTGDTLITWNPLTGEFQYRLLSTAVTSSQWTTSGSDIYYNLGKVGIGTTTPGADSTLKVTGGVNISQGLKTGYDAVINGITVGWGPKKGTNNTVIGASALASNRSSTNNTAIGTVSLVSVTTGSYNTAVGASAIRNDTSGNYQTAVGWGTLFKTNGSYNTALGAKSQGVNSALSAGTANTSVGYNSLFNNTSGYSNTAIGVSALYSNVSSSNLVAVGDSALYNNTDVQNTAVGSKALFTNTTGQSNTAVGWHSLYTNNGLQNTSVGSSSMVQNINGNGNTAIGFQTLTNTTTGSLNTAIGTSALGQNYSGFNNTGIGYASLYNNYSGRNNTAIGERSAYTNTSGFSNVAIGTKSLYSNTTASNLVAVGDSALYSNSGSGESNTAIGSKTLWQNVNGDQNTAIGFDALYNNTNSNNTAIGAYSLVQNIGGTGNTAVGLNSIGANTTGSNNTAVGMYSLYTGASGKYNSAFGYYAGGANTGYSNTSVGVAALKRTTTGHNNTAIGDSAGYDYTTISNRLYLGSKADSTTKGIYGDLTTGKDWYRVNGTWLIKTIPNSLSDTLLADSAGVVKKRLGAIDNWNEAYGWGNHANVGYLIEPAGYVGGDMYYHGNSADPGIIDHLPIGSVGQILRVKNNHSSFDIPEWATPGTALYLDTASSLGWKVSGGNTIQRLGGNVGIGTSTPIHKLALVGSNATNNYMLNIVNSDYNKIRTTYSQSTDTASFNFSFTPLGKPQLAIKNQLGAGIFVMDSTGKVGIGTTAPIQALDINGNAQVTYHLYFSTANTDIGYATDGLTYTTYNASGRGHQFRTGGTERLRITYGGQVGIRTTAPTNVLDVNGYTRLRSKLWVGDSTGTYSYVNPGDASFTTSSSREWKRNITDIPKPDSLLDKVLSTNPKTYQFKPSMYAHDIPKPVDSTLTDEEINARWQELKEADSLAAEIQASKLFKGFIAEDINQRFLGTDSKELNYTDITIILWQAVQQLILQNQNLDSRMRTVEYRLNELEKR